MNKQAYDIYGLALRSIDEARAHSIAVERFHGMEQVGVRLPVGPFLDFLEVKDQGPRSSMDRADPS